MSGILYLVATPIGNLNDMSVRGVETLREADFIAAEDTRVTGKLLNRFEIKKPSVSYHEHNKRQSGEAILRRLLAGETCALVTDAGMPAISDPGEDLVRLCAEHGVEVIAVPGCCAAVTALAVSGLPSRRFCFEGFLPIAHFAQTPPKGEFVLVLSGAPEAEASALTEDEALSRVRALQAEGLSCKDACRQVAKETGMSKNALYALAVK